MGIKHSGSSYAFVSQIANSKLKDNRIDIAFVGFEAYDDFSKRLSEVEQIFDWLVENFSVVENCTESFWYNDEKTRYLDIFRDADYQVRAVNYAILHFAKNSSYQPLNKDNFRLWWRPVHNLIANTDIDNSNFSNILKAIDDIPIIDIYGFLQRSSLSGFSEYQREEERRKAIMCIQSPHMTDLFHEQEKRKRFHGQIGLLLPDRNETSPSDWKRIVAVYEELVGDRYIERWSSDFDFITAMLTFAEKKDINPDVINGLKLRYESGHLRGLKIPARWINKMIFHYIENISSDTSVTPHDFFNKCREKWLMAYSKLSYEDKKYNAWIAYMLENYEECEKIFKQSDYGKLTKKDGNLWLYLKTNRNENDILLSNRRKNVIERLGDLVFQWQSDHDVVKCYSDIPFLRVVFASNVIWIGISRDTEVDVPAQLPDYMWSDGWFKARAWFPYDDLKNYYESEDQTFDKYIENLSFKLRKFCMKFCSDLNLNVVEHTIEE